jgi:class 3 adenylate cyclase
MYARGMGQGDDFFANLTAKIGEKMLPLVKDAVAKASTSAEPMIRRVIKEDVVPKVGLYIVIGLAGLAAVSAAIGSYMATRR